MQTQIHTNSLMMLLGASPVPEKLYEKREEPEVLPVTGAPIPFHRSRGLRPVDIRCAEVREHIRQILTTEGYSESTYRSLYEKMLNANLLNYEDGTVMNYTGFGVHVGKVRKSLGMTHAREMGKKAQILKLFDSGISEEKIPAMAGAANNHVYTTLVLAGRIQRRPIHLFVNTKEKAAIDLFGKGMSIKDIALKLNTRPTYIRSRLRKHGLIPKYDRQKAAQ